MRLGTPAHTHMHTRRHTWSPDPEVLGNQRAHVLAWWAFPGHLGKPWRLACAWLPLPPLVTCPVCTGNWLLLPAGAEVWQGLENRNSWVLRGLSHFPLKKKKKKRLYCLAAQSRAPVREAFPKAKEMFLKRKQLYSLLLSAVSLCCHFYFLDEIFVLYFPSMLRPCLLRGGSDPASQGLACHHHPSVPCVPCLAPPQPHHQHLPRGSRDALHLPMGQSLPAAMTSWE